MLCPTRKNNDGSPAAQTELELNSIRNKKKELRDKQAQDLPSSRAPIREFFKNNYFAL
jgi:hypothetical protein